MNRYLDIILSTFNNLTKPDTTITDYVAIVNLNFIYSQEYYPEILNILKENTHYSKDTYYDFYEITDMSSYIFHYLKSVIDEDIRNGTHIDVDEVISIS